MMRNYISPVLFLAFFCPWIFPGTATGQPGTEVYLFDLQLEEGAYRISNPVNISQNPGYDNQPSFLPDGSGILFSSNRDGQTDVRLYRIENGTSRWLTHTEGSEYSPTVMPGEDHFSAVVLEEDGTQWLWKYPIKEGAPEVLVREPVIGYYCWFDSKTVYAFVLGDPPVFQRIDLSNDSREVLAEQPGRSIHRIPGSGEVSFVSKADTAGWEIVAYHPSTGEKEAFVKTRPGSEDFAWAPAGHLFMGEGSVLYFREPGPDTGWKPVANLSTYGLSGITRLAVSPNGDRIAVVVQQ